ncbi:calcium/sodium antiporter [Wenzhouxiangella sp. AB-CW3]|uniref:calcium/sodium antiporter n=1 Tax=Wenzhouxiangella sp. AB-CW3 TaxID=2771012 RepID=UPI00168A65E7|nr:calcium/sodium antiporter [Wenzhouxiangella sp. AB-CW3]QOC21877.1 calcium/sodium antiporter [Wenzhouxiangella sp. AB-CW3]
MSLTIALLELAAGFVLLIWAADRLVTGASALARNFGVSTLVVGLTIVGFGTSAPEMLVSAIASVRGNPSLAIGNAVGSNIANIGLILGLTALIYPLKVERITLKREFPVLGVIMLLTLVLMWNLSFSRIDGLILIAGLAVLVGGMIALGLARGRQDPVTASLAGEVPQNMATRTAVIWTVLGLVLLPLSAHILVNGAVGLAMIVGVSEAVVGLTIVALGTSLPELAAAAACAFRREDDLAIGNILGSNMFNLLGVLGIAALIHPMQIEAILLHRDVLIMFAMTIALFVLVWRRRGPGLIGRPTALILFAGYLAYQGTVITQAIAG